MALNYLGAKGRITSWLLNQPEIRAALDSPAPVFFVDAFVGTGEVMRAARAQAPGHTYFGLDTLSSVVEIVNTQLHGHAHNRANADYLEEVVAFINKGLIAGEHLHRQPGKLTQAYAIERSYFSVDNALAIEHVWDIIYSPLVPGGAKDYLSGLLVMAADKVANVASVYAACLKKLKPSAKAPLLLSTGFKDFGVHGGRASAWVGDVADLSRRAQGFYALNGLRLVGGKPPLTVIYADPPYNQRDYATYYHLLETVAAGELTFEPQGATTGLPPKALRPASPFCSKRKAPKAFQALFAEAAALTTAPGSVFALSYSNEGIVPLEKLQELLAEAFENVDVRSTQIERFSSKAGKKQKAYVTEYLLVATSPKAVSLMSEAAPFGEVASEPKKENVLAS